MEANWVLIIIVIVAIISIIIYLFLQNQKDKNDFTRSLIDDDRGPNQKDPDTEVEPEE